MKRFKFFQSIAFLTLSKVRWLSLNVSVNICVNYVTSFEVAQLDFSQIIYLSKPLGKY